MHPHPLITPPTNPKQDVYRDPVVAPDGQTYERRAIAAWLARDGTSPVTRQRLPSRALVPNVQLRGLAEQLQASLAALRAAGAGAAPWQ